MRRYFCFPKSRGRDDIGWISIFTQNVAGGNPYCSLMVFVIAKMFLGRRRDTGMALLGSVLFQLIFCRKVRHNSNFDGNDVIDHINFRLFDFSLE